MIDEKKRKLQWCGCISEGQWGSRCEYIDESLL